MTNLTKDITKITFEIYDYNKLNNFDTPKLSYIQLEIDFFYKEDRHNLSLITSLSYDLSAVSMNLTLNKDSIEYFKLINELMNTNDIDMLTAEELLEDYIDDIIENQAQEIFDNYVYKNYKVNDYLGMDANSVSNDLEYIND